MTLKSFLLQGFSKIEPRPMHLNTINSKFTFYEKVSQITNGKTFCLQVGLQGDFVLECYTENSSSGSRETIIIGIFGEGVF